MLTEMIAAFVFTSFSRIMRRVDFHLFPSFLFLLLLYLLKILLDQVHCKGSEKSIRQCKHLGWQKSDCNNHEDAGVRCNVPQLHGHQVFLLSHR